MSDDNLRLSQISAVSILEILKNSNDVSIYDATFNILNKYDTKELEMWIQHKLLSIWSNVPAKLKRSEKRKDITRDPCDNAQPKRMVFKSIDDFDKLFTGIKENDAIEE
ncbi:unnamed protein product [Trichobilharzia szidati]|nr:unnamed protein product [Trichobilharzia szidati]